MTTQHITDHYISRADSLLKNFDRMMKRVHPHMVEAYGVDFAETIAGESRQHYELIIPELPYVGGRQNRFTMILIVAGWYLAFYRAMQARGKSAEETASILYHTLNDLLNAPPKWLLGLMGRGMLSRYGGVWVLKRIAARSQKREYPDDWVFEVVEGDGDEFDWALEFTECAVCKFWQAQDADALLPYCSLFDILMSKAMNLGMEARTIGEGHDTCVEKFKRGRPTPTRAWMPE